MRHHGVLDDFLKKTPLTHSLRVTLFWMRW